MGPISILFCEAKLDIENKYIQNSMFMAVVFAVFVSLYWSFILVYVTVFYFLKSFE